MVDSARQSAAIPSTKWNRYPPFAFRMKLPEHLLYKTSLSKIAVKTLLDLSESGFHSRSRNRGFNPDGNISTFQYLDAVSPARLSSAHHGLSRMVFKSRGTASQCSLCRNFLGEFE